MVNENLDTTNKLINPGDISPSDDDIIRQLSDNLQDITTEDVDAMCDEMDNAEKEEVEKKGEIPQELKDYREVWIKNIDIDLDDEGDRKEKIIKIAEKIPLKIEKESDGSKIIELKLGNKTYKILDVNITAHNTDDAYNGTSRINLITKNTVYLGGMMGDNKNDWENQRLKEYVMQKEKEGFHMPQTAEIRVLLNELGKTSNLNNEMEQTAMLMYLTGMLGEYRLDMEEFYGKDGRYALSCNLKGFKGIFGKYNDPYRGGDPIGNIFMITCEDDSLVKVESEEENNINFRNIGVIAGMSVMYDEKNRIVEFAGETFDLNPFEGKMSFMSKVGQYADLFRDENVRKVMLTLNI